MARLARIVIPGLPHAITQRGNRWQQTFFNQLNPVAAGPVAQAEAWPASSARAPLAGRDEHFLAVARYVEGNALRANLVVRAEEWRWSSLWGRTCGTAEEKAILAPWPSEVPHDWLARVNRPDNEKELEALRRSVQRGRPNGTTAWQKRITKLLGLESAYRSPGRPSITARNAETADPK
jgi:hypothetical protein